MDEVRVRVAHWLRRSGCERGGDEDRAVSMVGMRRMPVVSPTEVELLGIEMGAVAVLDEARLERKEGIMVDCGSFVMSR